MNNKSGENTYCLITEDDLGNVVVFDQKNRRKHLNKHPELADDKFIQGRVKRAIKSPDSVYESLNDRFTHCYYLEEFSTMTPKGQCVKYTKVVIQTNLSKFHVKTAFRPEIIKETKKLR